MSKQITIIPTISPPPPVPKQVEQLVTSISQQIALPKNETPSVATVTDLTKLQNQTFFQKAKNGDKVLIYQIAQKAVLYRPKTNEVIQISPLQIVASDNTVTASESADINGSSSAVLRIKL